MNAVAARESFRAAFGRKMGRPPKFDGLEDCPHCGRLGVMRVRMLGPDYTRAAVHCPDCFPFEICDAVGMPTGSLDVLEDVPASGAASSDDEPTSAGTRLYSLRELAENPALIAEPEPVAAPLLFRARNTLVASREKMGKSTLGGQLCAATSTGGEFLGATLQRRRCLWIGVDEGRDDVVRRLVNFGADLDFVDIAFALEPGDLTRWLADTERRPEVIVVDNLTEIASSRGISLNRPEECMPMLRPLFNAIRGADASGYWIAHSSKSRGELAGCVPVAAAADASFTLKPIGKRELSSDPSSEPEDDGTAADDGRRALVGRSRWGGTLRLSLAFVGGRYVLGGAPLPLDHRLMIELNREDGPVAISELAKRMHRQNADTSATVAALRREGYVITVEKKGVKITDSGRWAIRDGMLTRSGRSVSDGNGNAGAHRV